jgi:hypothetical protein
MKNLILTTLLAASLTALTGCASDPNAPASTTTTTTEETSSSAMPTPETPPATTTTTSETVHSTSTQ